MYEIAHRIGSTPRERGSLDNGTCPDAFKATNGDLIAIGTKEDPDALASEIRSQQREAYCRTVEMYRQMGAQATVVTVTEDTLRAAATSLMGMVGAQPRPLNFPVVAGSIDS